MVLHWVDPGGSLDVGDVEVKLLAKQIVLQTIQCPLDGQTIFFHRGIPGLKWLQLAAQAEGQMFLSGVALGQDSAKANCWFIYLHQEPEKVQIWTLENRWGTQAGLRAFSQSSDEVAGFLWLGATTCSPLCGTRREFHRPCISLRRPFSLLCCSAKKSLIMASSSPSGVPHMARASQSNGPSLGHTSVSPSGSLSVTAAAHHRTVRFLRPAVLARFSVLYCPTPVIEPDGVHM